MASTLEVRRVIESNSTTRHNRVVPEPPPAMVPRAANEGSPKPSPPRTLTRRTSFFDNMQLANELENSFADRKRPKGAAIKNDLASIQQYEKRHKFVIDPSTSKFMKRWDVLMLSALLFTAIVTPVEVSFLDAAGTITALWMFNRFIDLCFVADIILTFNMSYDEPTERGTHTVFDRGQIAMHYLKGWFLLDLVSVLPFFLVAFNFEDPWGDDARAAAAANDAAMAQALADGGPPTTTSSLTRATVLFRVVKLLRMLKLARIFKASRVIERTVLDIALHHWEWTFSMLKLIKFCVWLLFFAHFQACIWGLVSSFLPPPTWLTEFDAAYKDGEGDGQPPEPLERYAAALYWSVMTLTSIGYGEMTPVNTVERWLCSLWMMASGIIWTYAIGSVAAIATTLNPNLVIYETTMDQLNFFMRERALPRTMRYTLREFFKASRRVNQLTDDADLLSKLTPELQATVALAANREWLGSIWFFRQLWESRDGVNFIAALAKQLVIRNFVARERVPVGQLYIMRKGLVVKMWRFLGARKVWGEDFILDNEELMDYSQAVALSYVEVYSIGRRALDTLLADNATARHVVHRSAIRITMQRALLKVMARKQGTKGPRSIVLKSMASNPEVIDDEMSSEQKLSKSMGKLDALEHASTAMWQRQEAMATELAEVKAMLKILVDKA